MWILSQGKKSLMNLDKTEGIGIYKDSIILYASGEEEFYSLGTYKDHQRANEIFSEIITTMERGMTLVQYQNDYEKVYAPYIFKMPAA